MNDREFRQWVETLPKSHWAQYDLGACKLGWDAAMANMASKPALDQAKQLIEKLLATAESPAHERYGTRIDARHWLEDNKPKSCLDLSAPSLQQPVKAQEPTTNVSVSETKQTKERKKK